MKFDPTMTRRKLFGLIPLPFLPPVGQSSSVAVPAAPAVRFIRFGRDRLIDLTKIDACEFYESDEKRCITLWIGGERFHSWGSDDRIIAVRDYILDYVRSQGVAAPHGDLDAHLDAMRNA